ncbi:MAG: substrate-binding domain-containing protein [Verrucomicrobiota bacterium]
MLVRPAPGRAGGRAKRRRLLVAVRLDPRVPEIHAGILRAAAELRWDLDERMDSESRAFDGALVTTANDEWWNWSRDLKCPLIRLLGNTVSAASGPPADAVPTIAPDLAMAGEMAARHLLSLGTCDVVFFRNFGSSGPGALCEAFIETCRLAGREPRVIDAAADQSADRANWLLQKVAGLPLPCAIMADHDRFAVEIIAAAMELGLRVPEDIAVLGMENLSHVQRRSPVPVSSIDLNLELLGYTAAKLLDRTMRGEVIEPKHRYLAPKRLIGRQSTATFSCEVPGIAKAVLKIRSHYSGPVSVANLARECGMSVRNLYRLYRSTTGNTIGKDIMARRMEAAAEMLRNDSLKLEPIAIETGLGNAKNLCRLFKEHFGQTPGQWRASGNPFALG